MNKGKSGSRLANHLIGWFVYPAGDLVGQLILGDVNVLRVAVLMLAGGLFYRLEIPAWFRLLDSLSPDRQTIIKHSALPLFTKVEGDTVKLNWFGRTVGAMVYFNPLWIARHMLFISLVTTSFAEVSWWKYVGSVLSAGAISFLTNFPFSLVGNYLIQVRVPLRGRFFGSALLTTLLTIKYAIEYRLFG